MICIILLDARSTTRPFLRTIHFRVPEGVSKNTPGKPRRSSGKKVHNLLSTQTRRPSPLARLLQRSTSRDAWSAQLRALLPGEMGAECQVANVRDHVLSVHINNAAWATRFRLLIPDLVPMLNQLADFAAISEIRIKVEPFGQPSVSSPAMQDGAHMDRPNPPHRKVLTDFAGTLQYDQLREAILRLASHAELPTTTQESRTLNPPGGAGKQEYPDS
jgi:hypothetical protein